MSMGLKVGDAIIFKSEDEKVSLLTIRSFDHREGGMCLVTFEEVEGVFLLEEETLERAKQSNILM